MALASAYSNLVGQGPQKRLFDMLARLSKGVTDRPIRILDIGSGGAKYWISISDQTDYAISLDLFDPCAPEIDLNSSTRSGFRVKYINGIAPHDLRQIPHDSYDLVVAFDIIEHLPKSDGYLLLYEIDRLTIGESIIFTPNGMVWQPPSINNFFNAHISGWSPGELKSLGWKKVEGHTGIKSLVGPYGLTKIKGPLGKLVYLTATLVRHLPNSAFAFSAIKVHKPWEGDVHEGVTAP